MSGSLKVGVGTQVYSFEFRVSDAQRLKAAGMDMLDPRKYQELYSDIMRQMDLLTEFLKPQLDNFGVTELNFLDIVSSDPGKYNECMEALNSGLRNFFRNLGQESRVKVLDKAIETVTLAEQARAKKLDDPRITQVVLREIQKVENEIDEELNRLISGETSSIVPESSGLNRGIGRIDS